MFLLEILALSWFANLLVSFYIDLCIKARVNIRKPFGCEKCMGFWIGCLYFINKPFIDIFIFASITSLTCCLLLGIIKQLHAVRE